MKKSLSLCLLFSVLQVVCFIGVARSGDLPELKPGEEYEFFICSDDANQWLEVKLPQNGSLTANTFTGPEVNIRLKLMYRNTDISADTSGTIHRRRVESKNLYAGTYMLNVTRDNGIGTYTIKIDHEPTTYSYEKRPGEYFRNAIDLELNKEIQGLMGYLKEGDIQSEHWYKLEIKKYGALNIEITAERSLNYRVQLIEDNGSTVVNDDRHGNVFFRSVGHNHIVPGTYYLKLERVGGHGGYTIAPSFEPQKLAHENMGGEFFQEAQEIELGETITGILYYYKTNRTESWYKVTTETPGELRADIEAEGDLRIRGYLYDIDGRRRILANVHSSTPFRRVLHTHLLPGTYYLKIDRHGNAGGYSFVANHYPNKYAPEELPPIDRHDAQQTSKNELITGILGFYRDGQTRDHAWYKFETTQPGSFYFNIERIGGLNVGITAHDEYNQLAQSIHQNPNVREIKVENVYPGTYYLHLQKRSSYGSYKLRPVFITSNIEPSQRPIEDFEMAPVLDFDQGKTGIIGFRNGNETIGKSCYILRPDPEKQVFVSVVGNENLIPTLKLVDFEENKDLVSDHFGANNSRFVRLRETEADEIAILIERASNASSYFVFATQKQDEVMVTTTNCDFYLVPVNESKRMRIALINTNGSSVSIDSLDITGNDAFELKNSPNNISGNAHTVLEIEFSPEKAGDYTAQLNIQTEKGSFDVSLSGTAFEDFPSEEAMYISSESAEAWEAPKEPMRDPFVREETEPEPEDETDEEDDEEQEDTDSEEPETEETSEG